MSVLKGEGTHPILFGSTSIAAGTNTHGGYLARPDLAGEWPTIVVVAAEWGVTSSTKDLCRRLARQGFAVVAPDLYRGQAPKRSADPAEAATAARKIPAARAAVDLEAVESYITNPAGFWSNAETGFGLLGLGEGARFAVPFAIRRPDVPLALVSPRLNPPPPEVDLAGDPIPQPDYPGPMMAAVTGPLFGASGRDDETIPVDDVMALRAAAPHSEWVLYDDVGSHFTDDSTDGYDAAAHKDVLDRLEDFFRKHLVGA